MGRKAPQNRLWIARRSAKVVATRLEEYKAACAAEIARREQHIADLQAEILELEEAGK